MSSSTTKLSNHQSQQQQQQVFALDPPPIPSVSIQGSSQHFPVHRIYCVGRNYADHAREMGGDPTREAPFFFTKPADAVVVCGTRRVDEPSTAASIVDISYPLATSNLHHEIELVIAIGGSSAAPKARISKEDAPKHIFGLAVGVDLTRRDLQSIAKQSSRPWDSAKAFDQSAPISSIVPVDQNDSKNKDEDNSASRMLSSMDKNDVTPRIWLQVDGVERQSGTLSQMTWDIAEIVSILSQQFQLRPGDLIFTGTPAGVGPLERGNVVRGGVEGLAELEFRIV